MEVMSEVCRSRLYLGEFDLLALREKFSMEPCRMCGRMLGLDDDPLSGDCGGHCWGCVGWAEAVIVGGEDNPSVEMIRKEISWGWRDPDGTGRSRETMLSMDGTENGFIEPDS